MANHLRFPRPPRLAAAALGCCFLALLAANPATASELRRTPEVRAIEQVRPCVVNIHGHKTVPAEQGANGVNEPARRVNGMGTGLVIDQRGYVITNFHVVDGVSRIQVTMADGQECEARLVAMDRAADLAVIKIPTEGYLPMPRIGTSSDLMLAEPVLAVGNAFGYEHTVTRGVISGLNRPVEVTEVQRYDDLIQIDASINPGNSGGPLINIDGEVIGINVAVRVGAQGIAFAIPIDRAMAIAAQLISAELNQNVWHGIEGASEIEEHESRYVVRSVAAGSPAGNSGLEPGDVITGISGLPVERALDFQRALIGRGSGDEIEVTVERDGSPVELSLVLSDRGGNVPETDVWSELGLRLTTIPSDQFQRLSTRYNGGMRVTAVRPGSPAAQVGIRRGDVLLGMHTWETLSMEHVIYVLEHDDADDFNPLKFHVLRDGVTMFGFMDLTTRR